MTAEDDYTVKFVLKQPNSRFHTTFLDRWGCTRFFPKHIFEKEADPVQFTFNPYVGTGPYKLHSFDPSGLWTAWERREDWDKSPTGILYGQPVPKYIIYQAFTNEGAQILSQLTHQLDVADYALARFFHLFVAFVQIAGGIILAARFQALDSSRVNLEDQIKLGLAGSINLAVGIDLFFHFVGPIVFLFSDHPIRVQ